MRITRTERGRARRAYNRGRRELRQMPPPFRLKMPSWTRAKRHFGVA